MGKMLNTSTLEGRLAKTPKLRKDGNGKVCCTFMLVSEAEEVGGKRVDGIYIICFGSVARLVCERYKKGSHVIVHGRLRAHEREISGESLQVTEIKAFRVLPAGQPA